MNKSKLKPFLTGLGILAAGVIGFVVLSSLRAEPPKVESPNVSPLVLTVQPEVREGNLMVEGNGTVRPIREVNLMAVVPGRVTAISAALKTGGVFRQGEVLVQIDPSDYENAVTMAEAEVTQRRVDLLRAQEEVNIAREEWTLAQQRTGQQTPISDSALGSLALREPQLKLADAALKSAEARLADAQARLARTRVVAPFNGRIRSKNVDIGQFVVAGQSVGMAYSTDAVEIVVPFPSDQVALIDGLWTQERGSLRIPAVVHTVFGGQTYSWDGYVDRTEGMIDAGTRTVNVVVRVDQPYQIRNEGRPPLMVGMFTSVGVQGKKMERYLSIPREALRENQTVWVVENDRISIRRVEVIQEVEDEVYVQAGKTIRSVQGAEDQVLAPDGIESNERLVVSKLEVVTEGMNVRVASE